MYKTEEERLRARREANARKQRKYYQSSEKYREYKKNYNAKKKSNMTV